MKWTEEDRINFIKGASNPFRGVRAPSKFENRAFLREYNPELIVQRTLKQIKVFRELGLPYDTPEKWDAAFEAAGMDKPLRRASGILKKTGWTWDDFIRRADQRFEKSVFKPK